ncbi:MAG: DUF1272 domain-containing protein [Burkholderiaceae bacterium]
MLELRPICEHCATDLPPASTEARICSYECTFCATCVDKVLSNVCPNCGGGFVPRPVRPSHNHTGPWLGKHPAKVDRHHQPVGEGFPALRDKLKDVPPERR